ncbi:MAG: metal ABC transporter permease [Bacteroidaceae bacterium]|nr:metal ABC transporter permease [Bacteroidaceae bacterium]
MLELLQYNFFQNALIGSLLISIASGMIGTYIVFRRLSFISGGITHASFGGVGIGLFLGISPTFSAAVFAIFSSLGVEWLGKRKEMSSDSAIAIFWTFGMAVGIIFTYLTPGYTTDLSTYLFGNILTITAVDLYLLALLTGSLILFFLRYISTILSISFDREFARSKGINVSLFEYVLMIFIALTIVFSLRMVGIVLVISLLTIPQITAHLFSQSFKKIIFLSMFIAGISCLFGLYFSATLNIPSGASIIFSSTIIYLICKLAKTFFVHLSK